MSKPLKMIEINVKMSSDVGPIELADIGEAIKNYIYDTYLETVDDVTFDIIEVKPQ
jgi:hypothetical protein